MSTEMPADDAELFELIERYAPLVSHGPDDQLSVMISNDILNRYPELPGLLRCMASLDELSDSSREANFSAAAIGSSTGDSSFRTPRLLGPYQLEEELGRGGMGVVYRARHQSLQANFALKLIRSSEWASEAEVHRFYREARAAARLQHPHIVRVHDAGEQDGVHYLVMQHIVGGTLGQRLQQREYSPEEAAELMRKIALAVDYLHREGLVHRDLKPANILLDESGTPYVTDFGLAKVFDQQETGTASGMIVGTPAYMAPEQAWGRSDELTLACDIYSLGAMLYELLTGRPPYHEPSPLDQLLRLRDSEPIPPRKIRRSVPRGLEQICLRCLEKSPAQRYASAADLAADLERFLEHEPLRLPAIDLFSKLSRWVRREPALVARLIGFGVMASIVTLAEVLSSRPRAPYIPIMTVLAVWSCVSLGLQRMLTLDLLPRLARYIWVVFDIVLFTAAVSFAEGKVESLVVGYSLLIVAASFWYQPRLVWMMTGSAIIAYLVLLSLRGDSTIPYHYPLIVVGELLVVGGIVASLVHQIRDLLHRRTFRNHHS